MLKTRYVRKWHARTTSKMLTLWNRELVQGLPLTLHCVKRNWQHRNRDCLLIKAMLIKTEAQHSWIPKGALDKISSMRTEIEQEHCSIPKSASNKISSTRTLIEQGHCWIRKGASNKISSMPTLIEQRQCWIPKGASKEIQEQTERTAQHSSAVEDRWTVPPDEKQNYTKKAEASMAHRQQIQRDETQKQSTGNKKRGTNNHSPALLEETGSTSGWGKRMTDWTFG